MKNFSTLFSRVSVITLQFLYVGCVSTSRDENLLGDYYTRANIWYTNPLDMRSTNYHNGSILPWGTRVTVTSVKDHQILFTTEKGLSCKMLHVVRHSTISDQEFFERYFSVSDPTLDNDYTIFELNNIKEGNLCVGMSRNAVRASYGCPPSHATPDMLADRWQYWAPSGIVFVYFMDDKISRIECVESSGFPPRKHTKNTRSLNGDIGIPSQVQQSGNAGPEITSYEFDAKTKRGVITVKLNSGDFKEREYVVKNIGQICSDKNIMLISGQETGKGAGYRVLNERVEDKKLTIEFEAVQ